MIAAKAGGVCDCAVDIITPNIAEPSNQRRRRSRSSALVYHRGLPISSWDSCFRGGASPLCFSGRNLSVQAALHRGVVPDVARAAHHADDAVISHQPLELLAGVLAAAI
jgi:hypothetical protein